VRSVTLLGGGLTLRFGPLALGVGLIRELLEERGATRRRSLRAIPSALPTRVDGPLFLQAL